MMRSTMTSVLVLAILALSSAAPTKKQLDMLVKKRAVAVDGVIKWTQPDFDKYLSGTSRKFSLIIFCTASHMKDAQNLRLPELRANMGTLAADYKSKLASKKVTKQLFFVEMDFKSSANAFARLGVQSVPLVLHIGPEDHETGAKRTWNVSRDDLMKPEDYKVYPWKPEDFGSFVKARAHIDMGPIRVPTLLNHPITLTFLAAAIIPVVYTAWTVYQSSWFGHPTIWTAAVLGVFWFAASGGLFNIIRGTTMFGVGPRGMVWYTAPNAPGQLGAEGFFIGTMYIIFAGCCTTVVLLPKWLGGTKKCKVMLYAAMFFAMFSFMRVFEFYRFKTGYNFRFYLLESLTGNGRTG